MIDPTTTRAPILRIARPSRSLHATAGFYTGALGLEVLEKFTDHLGFDGVILGRTGWPYHLELTRQSENAVRPRPTAEDLLLTRRMRDAGQVLGIEMLDHVVLSDTGYVSLRERGWVR